MIYEKNYHHFNEFMKGFKKLYRLNGFFEVEGLFKGRGANFKRNTGIQEQFHIIATLNL